MEDKNIKINLNEQDLEELQQEEGKKVIWYEGNLTITIVKGDIDD